MTRYSKFIAALATAAATIASFLADGEISQNDIIGIIGALVGAGAVFAIPNKPAGGN